MITILPYYHHRRRRRRNENEKKNDNWKVNSEIFRFIVQSLREFEREMTPFVFRDWFKKKSDDGLSSHPGSFVLFRICPGLESSGM